MGNGEPLRELIWENFKWENQGLCRTCHRLASSLFKSKLNLNCFCLPKNWTPIENKLQAAVAEKNDLSIPSLLQNMMITQRKRSNSRENSGCNVTARTHY